MFTKRFNNEGAERLLSYAEEYASAEELKGISRAFMYLIEGENDNSSRLELKRIDEELTFISDKKKREQKRLRQYQELGYNYITRDKEGSITFFENKPKRVSGFFWSVDSDLPGSNLVYPCGDSSLFSNVQWDDETPAKISKIILENSWRGF